MKRCEGTELFNVVKVVRFVSRLGGRFFDLDAAATM